MARIKRRQPYNPALAEYQRQQEASAEAAKRSRVATEFNKGIARHITTMQVEDPLGPAGAVIDVARQTRNDPLGGLHARKSIDEAQYQGGRAFQHDFEAIQAGPQAIDASQPYVDRSFRHRSMSDAFSGALARLKLADKELGQLGASLTRDVLIHGMTVQQIGAARGTGSELELKYLGRRFRECLDCLALVYGFSMERR